jgi:hypothetical protein
MPPSIPEGAKLNGYRDYDVQDIIIKRHNIRFKLAEYITVEGKTYTGELPVEYQGKHYGPGLICYVMYQHCWAGDPIRHKLRKAEICQG